MTERQVIIPNQDQIQNQLRKLSEEFAFHIQEDHQGVPPTTCHRCLVYRQQIQFVEEDLRNFQKNMAQN